MRNGSAILRGPASVTLTRENKRIDIHNQGEAATVRSPARKSDNGELRCSAGTVVRRMNRKGIRQAAETRNDRLSSPKASEVPPAATMNAPSAGPTTPESCHDRLVSELALGRSSGGTIWGTEALYAGAKNASANPKTTLAA